MRARGIHHLGVAVHDLDAALETYRRLLGAELEHRALVEDQGVEAAAVLIGSGRVELLAPSATTPPSAGSWPGAGEGCTTSPTRSTTSAPRSASSSAAGAELIDEEPRPGLFGLQVAFVHPDAVHGVLSEVVSVG